MKRIRPARHYQRRDAPVRALADRNIMRIARSFKAALLVLDRTFDQERAEYLIANGRWREVASVMDVAHQAEAMKRPLGMLGNVWLEGGEVGARRINGQFNARSKVVRFRKAQASLEERLQAGPRFYGNVPRARTAPILDLETLMSTVTVEKDQADLFNFDRFDEVTQLRIRAYQDELIRQLGVDSRATIEATILEAMRKAKTPQEIMQRIRAVIGLTTREAGAIVRFREQLLDMNPAAAARALLPKAMAETIRATFAAGDGLSLETINAMVQRYQENYLDHRALTIANTETTRAASLGLQDSYAQAVDRGALPKEAITQFWQISLDETTCEHCLSVVDMNPEGVPFGQQFDSEEGPVDAPPMHPNCLPGDALVLPAGRITTVSKRWYDGHLVVIRTASGKVLSSTPNHPILTAGGWVPAHLVEEGHHVVSRRFSERVSLGADLHGENVPARIEDVAEAFGRSGEVAAAPVPVSPKDFHGDGEGSEIAVIWSNRLLVDDAHASRHQHGAEFQLIGGHAETALHYGLRCLAALLQRALAAANSSVSLRCLSLAGFGVHALPFQGLSLGLVPDMHATRQQPSADRAPANAKLVRDRLFGQSGLVQFDHVVSVEMHPFSGHVFNLQTTEGYYEANGIYTHNCRCSLEFVTDLDLVPD